MNRVLLFAVAAACAYYALHAREVAELRRQLAVRELELQNMTTERDAYLRAALKRTRPGLLERIAAEREQIPDARPVPKLIHPERTYTLAALCRVTGIREEV